MPFGKHRGCEVADLPKAYLDWLYRNVELREPLQSEVILALFGFSYFSEMPMTIDQGKIKRVYRELALKWHPDRGGSTEAMQALNEFYERLRHDPWAGNESFGNCKDP